MNPRAARTVAATVALLALLTACAPLNVGPVVSPVTVKIADLDGTTVKVALHQVVNLDTGSLATDSYSGKVADTAIATFTPGGKKGGADFNPGLTPHAVGTTEVTLSNADGGIQDVEFTLTVTK
jgi:hypothetical protein